ncbi:uncharacterized protein LOC123318815 [Coccinella septempunctata]|uniref:uncharacterized protein LOC123318815 n=1 Tax=Coccinella septempunctata TaxID=41139 RepID=UPI001D07DF28|nr:uncharacterized protein LOC123318815 [Coccinella septempunctata]
MNGGSEPMLTGAHLNVRSLSANFSEFGNTILNHNFDLVGVTETWLRADETFSFEIEEYNFVHNDRTTRGGGTGIYIKKNLHYRVVNLDLNLENTCIILERGVKRVLFCVIYKPPKVEGRLGTHVLVDDLENLTMASLPLADNLIVVGDMNVNVLEPDSSDSSSYLNSLQTFGLHQLVKKPTRKRALLDHILTDKPELFKYTDVLDCHYSDHDMPIFALNGGFTTERTERYATFRDFTQFSFESFQEELASSDLQAIFRIRFEWKNRGHSPI